MPKCHIVAASTTLDSSEVSLIHLDKQWFEFDGNGKKGGKMDFLFSVGVGVTAREYQPEAMTY